MRTTHYVFREVNAGRMTVEQGMAHIDAEQAREVAQARWLEVASWVAIFLFGAVLLAAGWAWAAF